jgi:DNA-binding IclR family transcriptional regulator
MNSGQHSAGQRRRQQGAQTLDRGIRILEQLGAGPRTASELAAEFCLHRTIVHRLLHTLSGHRLVTRGVNGRYRLGTGVLELGRGVERDLQQAAIGPLAWLAEKVGATAALTVRDGEDAVCISAVEPPHSSLHVAYRPGVRHPVAMTASGIAILAGQPPNRDAELVDPVRADAVSDARRRGFAVTSGQWQAGMVGVASNVQSPRAASVAVVGLLDQLDVERAGAATQAAAAEIAAGLGSQSS